MSNEYEERLEARARAIDPEAFEERKHAPRGMEGASEKFIAHMQRSRRYRARKMARATFAKDEADGYVLVRREATEEMVACLIGAPQARNSLNAAIAAGAVKEEK